MADKDSKTLKGYIIEDLDKLNFKELGVVYKLIRAGLIAEQNPYNFNQLVVQCKRERGKSGQ